MGKYYVHRNVLFAEESIVDIGDLNYTQCFVIMLTTLEQEKKHSLYGTLLRIYTTS
jgi:hypothetical protein